MSAKFQGQTQKRILLLVETSRVYGRQIIRGISRYATENANWTLFFQDRGLLEQEPDWLRSAYCDGIISRTTNRAMARILKELSVPVVELHGDGELSTSDVLCDDALLGRMAAEHFLERGLRNFAFFTNGYAWWSEEFRLAFQAYLQRELYECFSCPLHKKTAALTLPMVMETRMEHEIVDWLRSLPKPIGILCPSDTQAIFLVNICRIIGIAVPNEIAVLGVENNDLLCSITSPAISSIYVDGTSTGYEAARLLHLKLQGKALPELPIKIAPSFVVMRQSTNFIAVEDLDIAQAAQYIREHAYRRIHVGEIAEHVNLSMRTLNRKFQSLLGHTLEKEIIRARMEHAQKLLRETTLPTSVIAKNMDYTSVEYFTKSFRRNCGLTPQQYREKVLLDQ